MNWSSWKSLNITTRLTLIAVVPACLMFAAVMAALYAAGLADVESDERARGRLLAMALAQSSQFGVVSGNTASLARTLEGLVAADQTIAGLCITDARHKVIAAAGSPIVRDGKDTFEARIEIEPLRVELYDEPSGPHASMDPSLAHPPAPLKVTGYVEVSMSPGSILAAKRQHLLMAALMVLAAAAISAGSGWWLAKGLRKPLAAIMAALRAIRQGNYAIEFEPQQGELGDIQRSVVEMAAGLSITRQGLEEQVACRTAQLEEAMSRVVQADAEKRRLIARGNELVEDERRKIAVEIHDHLNATLISLRLQAMALSAAVEPYVAGHEEVDQITQCISETVDRLYASARNIVKQLRPELIDTVGLAGAIEEMVCNLDSLHPTCRFSFRADPELLALKGEIAMPAFRVAQEALNNVLKHANAQHCWVALEGKAAEAIVRVVIGDDGKGFETTAPVRHGIGLPGMRERAAAAGGTLIIETNPGRGTKISLTFPVNRS